MDPLVQFDGAWPCTFTASLAYTLLCKTRDVQHIATVRRCLCYVPTYAQLIYGRHYCELIIGIKIFG